MVNGSAPLGTQQGKPSPVDVVQLVEGKEDEVGRAALAGRVAATGPDGDADEDAGALLPPPVLESAPSR
jgi:hypothetical protein